MNNQVYTTSCPAFVWALKKLKITIWIYMAGMESESDRINFSPWVLSLLIENNLEAYRVYASKQKIMSDPKKMACRNEVIKSEEIRSDEMSVDRDTFTNRNEKYPIPRTVKEDTTAHASEASPNDSMM
ncbi:hypothetical protein [Pseudomonas akapageensis]|uniref:hypothetical protein n=1 Tax=Pseudomonas akapageensis TaxID=2609961 RepID=UPI001FEA9B60|nr:hypothetical protein [Pseudomonas akapageensis]